MLSRIEIQEDNWPLAIDFSSNPNHGVKMNAFRVVPHHDIMTAHLPKTMDHLRMSQEAALRIATPDSVEMSSYNVLQVVSAIAWFHRAMGAGCGRPKAPNGWRWVRVSPLTEECHPTLSLHSLTHLFGLKSPRTIEALLAPVIRDGGIIPGQTASGEKSYRIEPFLVGSNSRSFVDHRRMIMTRPVENVEHHRPVETFARGAMA